MTRGIATQESLAARRNTISHNLTALDHIDADFSMPRMMRLLHALFSTEEINAESSILVIGPRTESDLLILRGFGCRNVIGLDLISYSPWIKVGDMHAMPFQAESFDAVVCGWTLSYSTAPALAVSEIVRVVRNGGVVAIGVEHVPSGSLERRHREPRDANLISPEDDGNRINSVTAILELLGQAVKTVYVNIDAPLADLTARELEVKTGLASSQCIVVCSVNKP